MRPCQWLGDVPKLKKLPHNEGAPSRKHNQFIKLNSDGRQLLILFFLGNYHFIQERIRILCHHGIVLIFSILEKVGVSVKSQEWNFSHRMGMPLN